ncbi:response regulator [Burkholderia mayonis]|uniref:Two-component system response regulator n=1 Tax=Burkholderia mayonis TaxID=1385591 RepID=A0A1B4G2R1_9BURK|nr:response regulator [Burkholderia mayonis]AOJ10208.1 two-component system response regulator [Burkholderia mayonis]KVE53810.1 two-component system response regulator [Burkholderia mayonis]
MPNATARPNDIPPGRIIVLDDEAEIRNILQRFLASHGFDVRSARNSAQLDVFLEREPYDLLILDIMMPGEDGLAVCRRLRARGQTIPILMLTARGDPVDRVVGLELGADDYLAKPFLPRELLARIRAMLRRQQVTLRQRDLRDGVLQESGGAILRFGGFQLDTGRQALGGPNGVAVEVGSAEMRLLCALAQTPNRPVSRANLIERARGPNYDANTRSVDVQVLRLRQIIEADASAPRHIRTVWGIGYMLVAELES